MSKKKHNAPVSGTPDTAAKAAAPQPEAEAHAEDISAEAIPASPAPAESAAAPGPADEKAAVPAEKATKTTAGTAEKEPVAEAPDTKDASAAPAGESAPAAGDDSENAAAEEEVTSAAGPAEESQPAAEDAGEESAESTLESAAENASEAVRDVPADTAKKPAATAEGTAGSESAPETAPDADSTTEGDPDAMDEEIELPPIDEQRLLDMTRTVQLSVEQITENMEIPSVGDDAPDYTEDDTAEDDSPATVGEAVRDGVTGMARWLLLVLVFVLVVAGFGVAYLYRSATPDMLPGIRVTFAGQELEPAAYKWHVPVIGNWFKRTYAETYSSTPIVLEKPVSTLSPDCTISSTSYATKLTITDTDKETVFEGTLSEFKGFCFETTGTYTAKLVASVSATHAPGEADVTGSETWLFTFDVAIEPSVYLSESTVQQGSVATLRVTGSYEDATPTLTTTLKNQGFIQSSNGWVCYLPIPWNAALGTETIEVQVGSYSYTMYLKVTTGNFAYKDYSSQSQRAAPYIGQNDAPAKVSKLFTAAPTGISWADAGFVQPFLNRINASLTFGATEYVGRRYSERGSNTGSGGRTSTNVILSTTRGELVIAPASGKVELAEDLGGDYGYTLVIDHGAGVRTIFYGLNELNVKAGQQIKQGQTLASCGRTTIVEMRVGTVPIDPIAVWRGQCNGLKYY